MEITQDIKNSITQAKNICIIPSQSDQSRTPTEVGESLTAALALFYSLKELGKNVNLIAPDFPENLRFLIPTMDFISQPKNFVISIPRSIADISQVYYEKNEQSLKVHLTIDKGSIKKDDISFYFADAKPDLVITLGITDFRKELENKLDSFGYILESPILNIDNNLSNIKFGKINIIEEKSISEMVFEITKSLSENPISKNTATCLLTGLTLYYENFQNPATTGQVFELCGNLMKQGANRQEILSNIYKTKSPEVQFKAEPQVITS